MVTCNTKAVFPRQLFAELPTYLVYSQKDLSSSIVMHGIVYIMRQFLLAGK